MGTIDVLAAKLAEDTMNAMDETGQDRLFTEIGDVLATSSQTLEEAYLTEIRVRQSERIARRYLEQKLASLRAQKPPTNPG